MNTISWNKEGSLLISGSDDTLVGIWESSRWSNLGMVYTGHSRNIFAAEFVPQGGDKEIVSCGLDGEVRLSQTGASPSSKDTAPELPQ